MSNVLGVLWNVLQLAQKSTMMFHIVRMRFLCFVNKDRDSADVRALIRNDKIGIEHVFVSRSEGDISLVFFATH